MKSKTKNHRPSAPTPCRYKSTPAGRSCGRAIYARKDGRWADHCERHSGRGIKIDHTTPLLTAASMLREASK